MSRLPSAALCLLGSALLLLAAAGQADAQTRYLAFGDSITFGVGDNTDREEIGYPPRLEELLAQLGAPGEVINAGVPGETTAEGLSRIDSALAGTGADVLLLMEGTNDINARVSNSTIRFNLDQIARRALARGVEPVHATIIPRLPSANFDPRNVVTRDLAGEIRELAWETDRRLVDPFETFISTPQWFDVLYVGGSDKLHPDEDGYELLAATFADALTEGDAIPPVVGELSPVDDAQNVSRDAGIVIDLYDFGAGIDTMETRLLIDGEEVDASIQGDAERQTIRYQPPEPWSGVVFVELEAQDLATPPNRRDGTLVQFVTQGTVFLDGDITRDGRVDGEDLVALAVRFGSSLGDVRYRGFADLNSDAVIDGEDLAILSANFGRASS